MLHIRNNFPFSTKLKKDKKCLTYYIHDQTKFKKKVVNEYLNHDVQIQGLLEQNDANSGTLTINQKQFTPWTSRHNQVQ